MFYNFCQMGKCGCGKMLRNGREGQCPFPLTHLTTHKNLTKYHYTLINESEENSPLPLLFMTLLHFASKERMIKTINPAHATNQDHPDDDLVSSSCNLSYIYDLKVILKSRPYVIIGKILDGPPAGLLRTINTHATLI